MVWFVLWTPSSVGLALSGPVEVSDLWKSSQKSGTSSLFFLKWDIPCSFTIDCISKLSSFI